MPEGKKFEIRTPEKKTFEIRKTLNDIPSIEEGSLVPRSREDLARIVEEPMLAAAQIFFDKGISTWMSSANRKDIASGEVHLIIRFENLSARNKDIALRNGSTFEYGGTQYLKIGMPVHAGTTVREISEHMVAIANQFQSEL